MGASNSADSNHTNKISLSDEQVNQGVADARYLQYCLSHWLTDVRSFSLAATQALDVLSAGTGATPYAMPIFNAPPLPLGNPAAVPPILATVPVAPGALDRIFDLVQIIKRSPNYTEAIGTDLIIVGEEDTTEHSRPEFTIKVEGVGAGGCNCVKLRPKKFGHYAVAIYSKRGTGWLGTAGHQHRQPL